MVLVQYIIVIVSIIQLARSQASMLLLSQMKKRNNNLRKHEKSNKNSRRKIVTLVKGSFTNYARMEKKVFLSKWHTSFGFLFTL